MRFAPPLCLVSAALAAQSGASTASPPRLAGDLRQLLAICHVRDNARAAQAWRAAGWQIEPASGRQEARGAYGRIGIETARHPCELSFELASGTIADVQRIVTHWVKTNDAAPTIRDPRRAGGRSAIWALKRSTVKLEFEGEPNRGKLIVSYFPSDR